MMNKKIIIALLMLTALLASACSGAADQRTEIPQVSYNFHFPDFTKDIFKDPGYMELNRYISYTEGSTTILITEDYDQYGSIIRFFGDYIDTVIRGDHEKYNTFFSKEYIEENGEKDVFTMQQIYNVEIIYLGELEIEVDGVMCDAYEVALEYMIRQNNGTFRNDMGSDAIRRQNIILTETGESFEIQSVMTYSYAN